MSGPRVRMFDGVVSLDRWAPGRYVSAGGMVVSCEARMVMTGSGAFGKRWFLRASGAGFTVGRIGCLVSAVGTRRIAGCLLVAALVPFRFARSVGCVACDNATPYAIGGPVPGRVTTGFRCGPTPAQVWSSAVPGGAA